MTTATYQADGSTPFGTDLPIAQRFRAEIIASAQVVMVAGAAVALLIAAGARHDQPSAPSYRSQFEQPIALTAPAEVAPDSRKVLQEALTKAGLRPNYNVHRLTWDQARRINSLMPAAAVGVDAAKPFILSTASKDGREALHCLTQAAYFEAGGEGAEAQAAVAQVVLNRMRHPDYPKSVCGVVYQGVSRDTGCQFSFTCDGSLGRALDAAAWNGARKVAARALNGYVVPAVGAATYYHADYVLPAWAPSLVKLTTVGPHIFYRMSGEAGQAEALTGRYAGGELRAAGALLAVTRKAAEATVKLASVGNGERVHMQIAGDDAKLNAAQIATVTPVSAPTPGTPAPTIAPVASVAVTPAA